jgi:hypothetical protein
MTVEEMKVQITNYMQTRDWVSFPELLHHLGDEARGSFDCTGAHPNSVFWSDLSENCTRAISALLADKTLLLAASQVLVSALDGAILDLPIGRRPPTEGYSTRHWIPVCLRRRTFANPTDADIMHA